jgi:hypothetical protein
LVGHRLCLLFNTNYTQVNVPRVDTLVLVGGVVLSVRKEGCEKKAV